MTTIKPCPFCGSDNIEVAPGSTFRWSLAVCECGATGPEATTQTSGDMTKKEWEIAATKAALEAWNKRNERTNQRG